MQDVMEHDALEAGRIVLMLGELRLSTIGRIWPILAETADRDGWPAARFLSALIEYELAARSHDRIERLVLESRIPPGCTMKNFAFDALPALDRAEVMRLAEDDDWIERGKHVICYGSSGSGKSYLAASIGRAVVENGFSVLFTRAADLVRQIIEAQGRISFGESVARLAKHHLLILDDVDFAPRSEFETLILRDLIAYRYRHGSMLMTSSLNLHQIFGSVAKAAGIVAQSTIFHLSVPNNTLADSVISGLFPAKTCNSFQPTGTDKL